MFKILEYSTINLNNFLLEYRNTAALRLILINHEKSFNMRLYK